MTLRFQRKRDEQEDKFRQFTESAKRKKAETIDHGEFSIRKRNERRRKSFCFSSSNEDHRFSNEEIFEFNEFEK